MGERERAETPRERMRRGVAAGLPGEDDRLADLGRDARREPRGDATGDPSGDPGGDARGDESSDPSVAREAVLPSPSALLSLNLPNKLTLARLLLAPVFALLLLAPSHAAHVFSLGLYAALALTDAYDGWLARRTGIVTSFGKFMDPLADKVLISLALIVFLSKGLPFVPAHLVLLIVGREFLVTGLRSLLGYRGVVILPSLLAKLKTVTQNVFVLAAILTIVLRERTGAPIGLGDANPYLLGFLWMTTVLTLLSGFLYFAGNREAIRKIVR